METIKVHVKEKDKRGKKLSLLNLKDEVVNFLYKDTVAHSTKNDQLFFILIFFLSLRMKDKTALDFILEESIPKFIKLNQIFLKEKSNLGQGEYGRLVKEAGLEEFFKNDVFFVLVEAILNNDEILTKFSDYFKDNEDLKTEYAQVTSKYKNILLLELSKFKDSKIKDDRIDEYGNQLDLSKSVYRMVSMRMAKNLDLNLQKYTKVEEITSQSPIDLIFLQMIDPQIIFDLWDKYHLAEYLAKTSSEITEAIFKHVDLKIDLGDIVTGWVLWKLTKDKKEKGKAKTDLESKKEEDVNKKKVVQLVKILASSVIMAEESKVKRVRSLKRRKTILLKERQTKEIKDEIKSLSEQIENLENLDVTTEILSNYKEE